MEVSKIDGWTCDVFYPTSPLRAIPIGVFFHPCEMIGEKEQCLKRDMPELEEHYYIDLERTQYIGESPEDYRKSILNVLIKKGYKVD